MKTKNVYCKFSESEFFCLNSQAVELGFGSVSKLVEYAATLYVDMPRKELTDSKYIERKIRTFVDNFEGKTFICSAPFGTEWATMSTSAKRTAAAQLKKMERENIVEVEECSSKHHQAKKYRKVKKD